MSWNNIVVTVYYQPADPGSTKHFSESTEVMRNDLVVGQYIRYKDPSGILPSIKVVDMDDNGITLETKRGKVRLPDQWANRSVELAEGGRDYTNFWLHASINDVPLSITHDLNFLRKFYNINNVMSLTDADVEALRTSTDPYAKYGYARWLSLANPNDSYSKAYNLMREAADEGCYDAMAGLSLLWSSGKAGYVDSREIVYWRDEAVAKGSEFGAMVYARNRIAGFHAEADPEAVITEIERREASETDFNPRWYAILGFAYDEVGDKHKARQMYKKAIDNGIVEAYSDLAISYLVDNDNDNYRRWMEEGIAAGNGFCCILDANMDEEEFQKLEYYEQLRKHGIINKRLMRGVELGEGYCAYFLAFNYYHGELGYPKDINKAMEFANIGRRLADATSMVFLADAQQTDIPEEWKLDDSQIGILRLMALEMGDNSQLDKVIRAYNEGLYGSDYAEEVRREWLPKYKIEPLPNFFKESMEPTVLIIYPDGYSEYLEADISKFHYKEPFKEIAELIDAEDAKRIIHSEQLMAINKALELENMSVVMFYDANAEQKNLSINKVATKLNNGKEVRGPIVVALEGDFVPTDCDDSGYNPVESFTFFDDIETLFDEIYDITNGEIFTDEDIDDDDGRYDPYV